MIAAVTMAIRLRIMAVQMPVTPMPVLIHHTSMPVSIGHLVMAMVPYHASMSVPVGHFVRLTVRHTVDRSIRDSVHLSICHAVGSTVDTCVGWHIGSHCRGHQRCHQHCGSYEHDSAHFLLARSLSLAEETPSRLRIRRSPASRSTTNAATTPVPRVTSGPPHRAEASASSLPR